MAPSNSLFTALFGQEGGDQGSAAPAPIKINPQVEWPRGVPSAFDALSLLTGVASVPPELGPVTDRIAASLGERARLALTKHHQTFNSQLLLGSVGARWRIAAAHELKPKQAAPVATDALEQLLADADLALAGLRQVPADVPAEVKAVFDYERNALARAAVGLAEVASQGTQAVAAQVATAATQKYQPMAKRVTVYAAEAAGDEDALAARNRRRLVYGGVILLAGAFGLFPLFARPANGVVNEPVTGTVGTGTVSDTAVEFIHSKDGHPFDAETLTALKNRAGASGKTFKQIGPGECIISNEKAPPPARSPPAAPGSAPGPAPSSPNVVVLPTVMPVRADAGVKKP
jgi:hypothetical protein